MKHNKGYGDGVMEGLAAKLIERAIFGHGHHHLRRCLKKSGQCNYKLCEGNDSYFFKEEFITASYQGTTYRFHSDTCFDRFLLDRLPTTISKKRW
jgi:hypothetical protein